jgi:RsiW-degrading membrane proteinase PrsW (M82 family)
MDRKQSVPPWQSWQWVVRLALIAVFFTLLTVFVAENFIVVKLHFIIFKLETRLAWSLLLAAALGFSIGLLTARLRR